MNHKVTMAMKAIGLICLAFTLLLVGGKTSLYAAEPIKIGAIFSVTGWASFLGTPQQEAVEIVEEDVNRKGGVLGRPIKIYYEDDQSNPTNSAIAATKLIRDKKVSCVVGTSSTNGCMAMIPICVREEIAVLPPTPVTIPFNKWVYCVLIDNALHGAGMLKFMAETLDARNIGIIHSTSVGDMTGVKAVEENIGKYRVKIIIKEQFEQKDTNMIPQLTKIKAARPDAILLYGNAAPASVIAKNYQQLGMEAPVVCSWGSASKNFARLVDKVVAGRPWIIFGLKCLYGDKLPPDDPWRKNLYEPLKNAQMEKYGKEFQTFGANAHDALHIVVEALKIAGTDDRVALRDALEKVRYNGVAGDFACSPTNHIGMPVESVKPLVIRNGEYYPYFGIQ
jgi:branched-chain amino acid transport system substrate-binding protein